MYDYGFVEIGENASIARSILEKADEDFCSYLGYEDGIEAGVNEIVSADNAHKYWVIYIEGGLAGLCYIYDYKRKYGKCSIGYGLLKEYRNNGYSTNIINAFCEYLEESLGIVRIQADIEITNSSCIGWFARRALEMDFVFECEADNYWGLLNIGGFLRFFLGNLF